MTELSGAALVEAARTLAQHAHEGQVDKAGRPYITHPARVAARLPDDTGQAVAWLHDVVEDTAVTLEDLSAAGFPPEVVRAVDALTHRDGDERTGYYARLAADPLALRVKHADLDDNSDPQRLAALDAATRERLSAKYAAARRLLPPPASR